MFAARQIIPRLLQQAGRRSYGHGSHFKPPTMDELPVPSGSWKARYDAKQRGYNAVLLLGIAFTGVTFAVAKSTGLVYLNYYPPKSID